MVCQDHIPGVRGKLLVTETTRHDLLRRGRTACLWDDLDHSTLPMAFPHDTEEWILAGYVLDPLFDLGLIERRKASQWPSITEYDFIRVTPLWRKFISFAKLP